MPKLVAVYDSTEDAVAPIETLRLFSDRLRTELRTLLLTGVFANNPDDLEVTVQALSDTVLVNVQDLSNLKEPLSKRIKYKDFLDNYRGDGDNEPYIDKQPFTEKQTEDKFMNKTRLGDAKVDAVNKIKEVASDIVGDYLKAKQLK